MGVSRERRFFLDKQNPRYFSFSPQKKLAPIRLCCHASHYPSALKRWKMERLAHICGNWGTWGCHPDVREFKRLTERKNIPLAHAGEELEKLDEICKKCKLSYFIVKGETCPVCKGENVEIAGISHSIPGMEMTHGYRCNNKNCETLFWILEKDLILKKQ